MGRPPRRIKITAEQNEELKTLELNKFVHEKVRLRARILRLHFAGWTIPMLAAHFDRNQQTIHTDFDRFEAHGIAGLADIPPPGHAQIITPEIKDFLRVKLAEEQLWNSHLLVDAVFERFGVKVTSQTIVNHLHEMGYSWKRARYSPGKTIDPALEVTARTELEGLKRGHWTAN